MTGQKFREGTVNWYITNEIQYFCNVLILSIVTMKCFSLHECCMPNDLKSFSTVFQCQRIPANSHDINQTIRNLSGLYMVGVCGLAIFKTKLLSSSFLD